MTPRKRLFAALALLAACAGQASLSPTDETRVDIDAHGLSAIEVTDNGTRFTALSDRGILLSGDLLRSGGQLTEARIDRRIALQLSGDPDSAAAEYDSEGLALLPDGRLMIAFEGQHRLATYTASGALRSVTHFPEQIHTAHLNRGVEALARLSDGALIAIGETPFNAGFPVWRLDPGAAEWTTAFTLAAESRFRPVGADVGPTGRIFLLERAFAGVGFAARIRSMETNGADLRVEATFPLGQYGNLEGLSVWCDQTGRLRATMVEDDNGLVLQRGGVVEVQLTVDSCGGTG